MAVFAVTNTNDSGDGSLRSAILQANASPGLDRIEFLITGASKTISPSTPLPWLEDTIEIDGTTQAEYIDRPVIELNGSAIAASNISGLVIASDNSVVRGLTINNFTQGITILDSSGAVVAGNHLGINSAGSTAAGNRSNGVYIVDSSDNLIGGGSDQDRNIISGNDEHGVRISGNSTGNRIQGNYIGTDAAGLAAVPNKQNGVFIGDGATQNLIGTDSDGKDDSSEGNIIAGNLLSGVLLSGTQSNRIAGNRIGVGSGAHTPLGNGSDGISIAFQSSLNIIGTNRDGNSDSLEANVIACNKDNGVRVNNSRANLVSGNFIGLLSDGVTGSPNVNAGILIDGGSQSNIIGRLFTVDTVGGNVISANGSYGVWISNGILNSVYGNVIGRTADNQAMLPNLREAIRLTNASTNAIGAVQNLSNSIGYGATAIVVDGDSQSNAFDYNDYIGTSGQPIDLGGDGVTANDVGDGDTGPNALQNFPTIELATNSGVISGKFNSRPFRTYRIGLYVTGPATAGVIKHELISSFDVQTNANGVAAWTLNTLRTFALDQAITAIANELNSGTSEFSANAAVVNSRSLSLSSNPVAENVGSLTGTVFRTASDAPGDVFVALSSSDPTRAVVPAQVVIPTGTESASFTIDVLDDSAVHYDQLVITALAQSAGAAAELSITDNDNPWHNHAGRVDANGDGRLSAIDALLVINELNNGRTGSLLGRTQAFPPIFIDVNDDDNVTSFDALLIINAINSGGSIAGEGEGQTMLGTSTVTDLDTVVSDGSLPGAWYMPKSRRGAYSR